MNEPRLQKRIEPSGKPLAHIPPPTAPELSRPAPAPVRMGFGHDFSRIPVLPPDPTASKQETEGPGETALQRREVESGRAKTSPAPAASAPPSSPDTPATPFHRGHSFSRIPVLPPPRSAPLQGRFLPNVIQRKLDPDKIEVGDTIQDEKGNRYEITAVEWDGVTAKFIKTSPEDAEKIVEFEPGGENDTYTLVGAEGNAPVESKQEIESKEAKKEAQVEIKEEEPKVKQDDGLKAEAVENKPTLTWEQFKKMYPMPNAASSIIQQFGVAKSVGKAAIGKGKIAYVANIVTLAGAGKNIQEIIDSYVNQGVGPDNYGSFAMVIGINKYRSLDGSSPKLILDVANTANDAPFPCAVVSFMWDFNWAGRFQDAHNDFMKMGEKDRQIALQAEKANLVQSVIPYGQLRERVTSDTATANFLSQLRETHDAVYIHLGDDDAVSLFAPNDKTPLMSRYTDSIEKRKKDAKSYPPLVVGGYEFRTEANQGDLEDEKPAEALTACAGAIDIWFRSLLAVKIPDLVYPTEPNLAFLAGDKKRDYLNEMLTPDKQVSKRLEADQKKALEVEGEDMEPKVTPHYSSGLLYGRKTNEGGNLRDRIKAVSQGGPVTRYDPSLGIATSSKRFTLRDEDKVRHEKNERTYGDKRSEAFSKGSKVSKPGPDAYRAQIVEDMLTLKQSHVGGLAKELEAFDNKMYKKATAQKIATDVQDTVKALLLDQNPPDPSKEAKPFIAMVMEKQGELNAIKQKMKLSLDKMTSEKLNEMNSEK